MRRNRTTARVPLEPTERMARAFLTALCDRTNYVDEWVARFAARENPEQAWVRGMRAALAEGAREIEEQGS